METEQYQVTNVESKLAINLNRISVINPVTVVIVQSGVLETCTYRNSSLEPGVHSAQTVHEIAHSLARVVDDPEPRYIDCTVLGYFVLPVIVHNLLMGIPEVLTVRRSPVSRK